VLASAWGSFFDVVAVLVVLGVAAAVVAALLVRRTVRRRWRLVRSHGAVIALLALWDATAALRARRRRPLAGDNWSSPRRVRRSLWQAVDGAADAVRTAADLGAPVAELPSLCRRLEGAVADLDRVLRLEPAGPVPPSIRGHVQDVMRAADDVRRVAIAAAADACDPRVAELARDADDEVQLLDAGMASARAALAQLRR
jgi:hypothetical protein